MLDCLLQATRGIKISCKIPVLIPKKLGMIILKFEYVHTLLSLRVWG